MSQELLLLLVPSLHFIVLLFKYLSIVLGDVRENRGRHSDTEKRQKLFFSVYVLLT